MNRSNRVIKVFWMGAGILSQVSFECIDPPR
jgi:hypothetical protein